MKTLASVTDLRQRWIFPWRSLQPQGASRLQRALVLFAWTVRFASGFQRHSGRTAARTDTRRPQRPGRPEPIASPTGIESTRSIAVYIFPWICVLCLFVVDLLYKNSVSGTANHGRRPAKTHPILRSAVRGLSRRPSGRRRSRLEISTQHGASQSRPLDSASTDFLEAWGACTPGPNASVSARRPPRSGLCLIQSFDSVCLIFFALSRLPPLRRPARRRLPPPH
jgi:hypothetical protein